MQPVWNEPALTFERTHEGKRRRYVVASETHIGFEGELARRGAFLKSRSLDMARRMEAIAADQKADHLILLGDVKHRVTHLTPQERRDVPAFFQRLSERFGSIDIAQGNHDTGLAALLPRRSFPKVRIHPSGGFVVKGDEGDVGCLHGHAWPRPSVVRAPTLLVGHTHAAVAVVDEQGRSGTEWAWVRARLDPRRVLEKYGRRAEGRVIVFPPFNPLLGGSAVNRDGILGPLARLIDADAAEVFLLDGRSLGPMGLPPPKRSRLMEASRD